MQLENVFDYIIVGAGSAGCVLASRLSEGGDRRVLLLEAGGYDHHPYIHIPLGMGKLHERRMFDWGYQSEPESALANRRIEAMRGKVLGGSSSINVMAYTRGHPEDYNRWARHGARGWAYDDVLPYFRKSETWEGGPNEFRGGDGPLQVTAARTKDPLFERWLDAARAANYPITDDFNGRESVGFGRGQFTIGQGRRSSAATAYLKRARKRKNLTTITGAHVAKLLFDDHRVNGVEYIRDGELLRVGARIEVVLCAGVFNTPQILMLSGIGPAAHLQSLGITVRRDLPVGRNLQDHLACAVYFARPQPGPFHALMRYDRMSLAMLQAYFFGSGPATYPPGGLLAFIKTKPDLDVPDIEFIFRGAPSHVHLWFPGVKAAYRDGFAIRPTLLHPKSRGEILLSSRDPLQAPKINFNFFSHPDDLATLRSGISKALELVRRPELDAIRGEQITAVPETSDDDLESWIRRSALTAHHPSCTCPMGSEGDAVVDPTLRVYGIEGLRIADASVMPDLISAHINACVIMIAEKAADLIAASHRT